jgi:hypothetical protein
MSVPEGWNGKSIKDHIESAKSTADCAETTAGEALELARENTDDLATIKAEMAEMRQALEGVPTERALIPIPPLPMGGYDKAEMVRREIRAFSDFQEEARLFRRELKLWDSIRPLIEASDHV